jgi:hypothetical protein
MSERKLQTRKLVCNPIIGFLWTCAREEVENIEERVLEGRGSE